MWRNGNPPNGSTRFLARMAALLSLTLLSSCTAGDGRGIGDATVRTDSLIGATDSVIYLAETGDPELSVLGHDGKLRRIVRLGLPVREVTTGDVERIRAQYLAGLPPDVAAEIQPRLDAVSIPATMPYFSQLNVSADGTVWLQYHQAFRDEEVTRWTAVDPTGVWLGDVSLPDGFTVHQFQADHVVGLGRDELGVEFVRQHSIEWQQ